MSYVETTKLQLLFDFLIICLINNKTKITRVNKFWILPCVLLIKTLLYGHLIQFDFLITQFIMFIVVSKKRKIGITMSYQTIEK